MIFIKNKSFEKAHTERNFLKYQSIRTNQSGREITQKFLSKKVRYLVLTVQYIQI